MTSSLSRTALAAVAVSLATATLAISPARAQQRPDVTPYLVADRAAELAMARSAAPRSISDSATIYVLAPNGFVQGARGTNGFACIVLRGFSSPIDDPDYWNPRVRAPHCFNPPAARTVLPEILARAEWVLSGVSPKETDARSVRGHAAGTFPAPEVGSIAYMLSPQQYLVDRDPHWLPHVMFYFDRTVPASALGAGSDPSIVIDATGTDPNALVRTLLIPVRRWSDGSAAAGH